MNESGKNNNIIDFHVHTNLSYDSYCEEEELLASLNGNEKHLVLANHDVKSNTPHNRVLDAYEKTLSCGTHVIALFCPYIEESDFFEFTSKVRMLGGVTVLVHPFRSWSGGLRRSLALSDKLMYKRAVAVDGIEVFNAKSSDEENQKALEICAQVGKIPTAGSDAHTSSELFRSYMISPVPIQDRESFNLLKEFRGEISFFHKGSIHKFKELVPSYSAGNKVSFGFQPTRKVEEMSEYHISKVGEIVEELARTEETFLKLDWNEYPEDVPNGVKEEVCQLMLSRNWNFYPAPSLELRNRIASINEVSSDQVLLTNGSDDALSLVVKSFVESEDSVLITDPGYDNFRVFVESCGALITKIRVSASNFFQAIYEGLSKGGPFKSCYLNLPHNPLGIDLTTNEVEKLLKSFPETLFILDEAYVEFSNNSKVRLVDQYANIVITRSFSKAYGMAYFRLGYILSSVENCNNLLKLHNPKTVNGVATIVAERLLRDDEYIKKRVDSIFETKRILKSELESLGFKVEGEVNANFMIVRHHLSRELLHFLNENNIFLRDISRFSGYENSLRISIPSREGLEGLVQNIKAFLIKWKKKTKPQFISSEVARNIMGKLELKKEESTLWKERSLKINISQELFEFIHVDSGVLSICSSIIGKNIFYCFYDGKLYLSEKFKDLIELERKKFDVNRRAVDQINERGYVLTNETCHPGIFTLNPFFLYRLCDERLDVCGMKPFLKEAIQTYGSSELSTGDLLDLFYSLTEIYPRDKKHLLFLSGGVDSATLLFLLSNKLSSLSTFTYYPFSSEDHRKAKKLIKMNPSLESSFFWRGELPSNVLIEEHREYCEMQGGTLRGLLSTPFYESKELMGSFDRGSTGFLGDPVMGSRVTPENIHLKDSENPDFRQRYIFEEKLLRPRMTSNINYIESNEIRFFLNAMKGSSDLCFLEFFDIVFRQTKYFGPEILAPFPLKKIISPYIYPPFFKEMMKMAPKQRLNRSFVKKVLEESVLSKTVKHKSKLWGLRKEKISFFNTSYAKVKYVDYQEHFRRQTPFAQYLKSCQKTPTIKRSENSIVDYYTAL